MLGEKHLEILNVFWSFKLIKCTILGDQMDCIISRVFVSYYFFIKEEITGNTGNQWRSVLKSERTLLLNVNIQRVKAKSQPNSFELRFMFLFLYSARFLFLGQIPIAC